MTFTLPLLDPYSGFLVHIGKLQSPSTVLPPVSIDRNLFLPIFIPNIISDAQSWKPVCNSISMFFVSFSADQLHSHTLPCSPSHLLFCLYLANTSLPSRLRSWLPLLLLYTFFFIRLPLPLGVIMFHSGKHSNPIQISILISHWLGALRLGYTSYPESTRILQHLRPPNTVITNPFYHTSFLT